VRIRALEIFYAKHPEALGLAPPEDDELKTWGYWYEAWRQLLGEHSRGMLREAREKQELKEITNAYLDYLYDETGRVVKMLDEVERGLREAKPPKFLMRKDISKLLHKFELELMRRGVKLKPIHKASFRVMADEWIERRLKLEDAEREMMGLIEEIVREEVKAPPPPAPPIRKAIEEVFEEALKKLKEVS